MLNISKKFQGLNGCINTFVNPYSYPILSKSFSQKELAKFKIYADGILVVWFERLFRENRIDRVSFDFSSIAGRVFTEVTDKHKSISIVGADESTLLTFIQRMNDMFPTMNIIYTRHGYFDGQESWSECIEQLLKSDVVVVGMGTPLQEKMLLDLSSRGWQGSGFTCGGFIDQTAQSGGHYYPEFINQYNLRWLYRLIREPRRLWRRYLLNYPYFVFYYIKGLFE